MNRRDKESRAAILKEQMRRRAKNSLLAYVLYTFGANYKVNWHHREVCEAFEDVESGKTPKLMVTMPPRSGKSTIISIHAPAWYLGRHPEDQIIATAYGGELVSRFGGKTRELVASKAHQEVFGDASTLSKDTKARDHWNTKGGGVYRGAGVGAGITGFGGHLILVDDPVKSREEADSETIQNKVWDWWRNDVYTRRMSRNGIVIVGTRWSEGDLMGRLLDTERDEWKLLHYPALNEKGESLWPGEFSADFYEGVKKAVGPRAWTSLYQGSPAPEEGAMFKATHFLPSPRVFTPTDVDKGLVRTYGASDYAVVKGDGDYTVHVVVGVDGDDNIHVLDLWREQAETDVWVDVMLDMMEMWKPMGWAEGKGSIQRAVAPFIDKRMAERKTYYIRNQIPETADKAARASSFHARMSMGKVFWPQKAGWYADVRHEMLTFPHGKHDDAVDAFSLIGRMLSGMMGAKVESKAKPTLQPALTIGDVPTPPGMKTETWGDLLGRAKKQWANNRRRR